MPKLKSAAVQMQAQAPSSNVATRRFDGYHGVTLAADLYGPEDGPPVILLHGGGQTRNAWGNAARELGAAGHFAVALDLRGHGESDWAPDADYSIDAQAGDLKAVIGQLNGTPAVIGASMGGLIAMTTIGESAPDIASALVLVDVTPKVDLDGRSRIIAFMQANPDGFTTLEEAADVIAAYLPHRPRPSSTAGLSRNLRQHPDGRYRWHWDPRFFETFEPDVNAGMLRYSKATGNITIPTLLVRGSRSELVSEESVQHFRALMPAAEFVDVQNASHMVAGDRNDVFNAAVLEFLGRVA
jgi:pimeloyl-ACP methyl ester carboxylesterase